MPLLIELLLTFAKIGLFTYGGGYAMIALILTLICLWDIKTEKRRPGFHRVAFF